MSSYSTSTSISWVDGLSMGPPGMGRHILGSLPDSWNTLVVSLGNSTPKGKVTLAMVRNSLFNEEIRMKDFVGNDTHALVTKNKGRSKSKGHLGITSQEADPNLRGK